MADAIGQAVVTSLIFALFFGWLSSAILAYRNGNPRRAAMIAGIPIALFAILVGASAIFGF